MLILIIWKGCCSAPCFPSQISLKNPSVEQWGATYMYMWLDFGKSTALIRNIWYPKFSGLSAALQNQHYSGPSIACTPWITRNRLKYLNIAACTAIWQQGKVLGSIYFMYDKVVDFPKFAACMVVCVCMCVTLQSSWLEHTCMHAIHIIILYLVKKKVSFILQKCYKHFQNGNVNKFVFLAN